MPARELELVLGHDGRDWVIQGHGIHARAGTLPGLDRTLARCLAARDDIPAGSLTVHMRFDPHSLPGWISQYMSHYFNRTVRIRPAAAMPPAHEPG